MVLKHVFGSIYKKIWWWQETITMSLSLSVSSILKNHGSEWWKSCKAVGFCAKTNIKCLKQTRMFSNLLIKKPRLFNYSFNMFKFYLVLEDW